MILTVKTLILLANISHACSRCIISRCLSSLGVCAIERSPSISCRSSDELIPRNRVRYCVATKINDLINYGGVSISCDLNNMHRHLTLTDVSLSFQGFQCFSMSTSFNFSSSDFLISCSSYFSNLKQKLLSLSSMLKQSKHTLQSLYFYNIMIP